MVLAPAVKVKYSLRNLPSDHKSGEKLSAMAFLAQERWNHRIHSKITYMQGMNSVLLPSPFTL